MYVNLKTQLDNVKFIKLRTIQYYIFTIYRHDNDPTKWESSS